MHSEEDSAGETATHGEPAKTSGAFVVETAAGWCGIAVWSFAAGQWAVFWPHNETTHDYAAGTTPPEWQWTPADRVMGPQDGEADRWLAWARELAVDKAAAARVTPGEAREFIGREVRRLRSLADEEPYDAVQRIWDNTTEWGREQLRRWAKDNATDLHHSERVDVRLPDGHVTTWPKDPEQHPPSRTTAAEAVEAAIVAKVSGNPDLRACEEALKLGELLERLR